MLIPTDLNDALVVLMYLLGASGLGSAAMAVLTIGEYRKGEKPDTHQRFMRWFVTACVALAVFWALFYALRGN